MADPEFDETHTGIIAAQAGDRSDAINKLLEQLKNPALTLAEKLILNRDIALNMSYIPSGVSEATDYATRAILLTKELLAGSNDADIETKRQAAAAYYIGARVSLMNALDDLNYQETFKKTSLKHLARGNYLLTTANRLRESLSRDTSPDQFDINWYARRVMIGFAAGDDAVKPNFGDIIHAINLAKISETRQGVHGSNLRLTPEQVVDAQRRALKRAAGFGAFVVAARLDAPDYIQHALLRRFA